MPMRTIEEVLGLAPVIPVLTIERSEWAVPLARALVAGGLRALEITLRTDVALDAVRAIAQSVPDAVPGVGTVTTPEDLSEARAAGAHFAVSPGFSSDLVTAAAISAISARDRYGERGYGGATDWSAVFEVFSSRGNGWTKYSSRPCRAIPEPYLLPHRRR